MTLSNVLSRRAAARVHQPARDLTVTLVIALMMALVFTPVIGFHVAVSLYGNPDATAAMDGRADSTLVAAPITKRTPG